MKTHRVCQCDCSTSCSSLVKLNISGSDQVSFLLQIITKQHRVLVQIEISELLQTPSFAKSFDTVCINEETGVC